MNTCDTCIHWKPRKDGAFGDCDSDKWLRGYSTLPEEFLPDSVLVEDDEGWGFETGPKFGCVHWELRS